MKRIAGVMVGLVAALFSSVVAIRAAQNCPVSFGEYDKLVQSNMKDVCLLVARNCAMKEDTVQQRVDDLRREVAKGSYVYTPAELRVLKEQLHWIEAESGNRFI